MGNQAGTSLEALPQQDSFHLAERAYVHWQGEKSPLILLNVGVVKTLATVDGFWMPSCQKKILNQIYNKLETLPADLACVVPHDLTAAMILNTRHGH